MAENQNDLQAREFSVNAAVRLAELGSHGVVDVRAVTTVSGGNNVRENISVAHVIADAEAIFEFLNK